jgi:protease-4
MPGGQLDLTGLATYELFFRGSLDKLGIQPDLLHIGDYKTFSNTFTEKSFTKAHLEMTQSLNRDQYDELVRAIAAGRKRTVEEVRKAIDDGPFLADQAKQAGLVDAVAYEDQLDDDKPIAGTQRLEASTYSRVTVSLGVPVAGARIALLYATGSIASGSSSFDGSGVIGSATFASWLRKVRIDPGVRAVVVRVDSPGGSAIASEAIWRELMLTREKMPVIVSMGDVAASGGYYIAAPAHVIVAEPGTLTGSIGVVTGKFVLDGRWTSWASAPDRPPTARTRKSILRFGPSRRRSARGSKSSYTRRTSCFCLESSRAASPRARRSTPWRRAASGPATRRWSAGSSTRLAASIAPFRSRRRRPSCRPIRSWT